MLFEKRQRREGKGGSRREIRCLESIGGGGVMIGIFRGGKEGEVMGEFAID